MKLYPIFLGYDERGAPVFDWVTLEEKERLRWRWWMWKR